MVDGVVGQPVRVRVLELPGRAKPLVDLGWDRAVGIEQKPRLDLCALGKRKPELADVAPDSALGRPAVLERLDVEEDADQVGRLVAVTIATVSSAASRSEIAPSTRPHAPGSRR